MAPQQDGSGDCKLLGLPAELRNDIYKLVLDTEHDDNQSSIHVTRNNFCQPALLRVNRQIREETRTMWYYDRSFKVAINDFDPSVLVAFWRHAHVFAEKRAIRISLIIADFPTSWTNLLKWLKLSYEDDTLPIIGWEKEDGGTRSRNAGRAFKTMVRLRDDGRLGWELIEDVLDTFREATSSAMHWEADEKPRVEDRTLYAPYWTPDAPIHH